MFSWATNPKFPLTIYILFFSYSSLLPFKQCAAARHHIHTHNNLLLHHHQVPLSPSNQKLHLHYKSLFFSDSLLFHHPYIRFLSALFSPHSVFPASHCKRRRRRHPSDGELNLKCASLGLSLEIDY